MDRKVGLRSGQRPQGYNSSSEGLQALEDAKRDALRARRERGPSFASHLRQEDDEQSKADDPQGGEQREPRERMTFHPNGPRPGGTGSGGPWRIKG